MHKRITGSICLLLMVLTHRALAQIQKGELSTNLSGSVSAGYTGDFGNLTPSDHGISAGGTASLTGSYFDPNFLSFNVLPFYNQSRENSDYQSITSSSGVTASASIFGGSNFPGSFSYSKLFNSDGNFGVPGIANYTSHGDSDVLNVGWAERVPNLPSLSLAYQQGSNSYSLYGLNTNSFSDSRSVVATTNYMIEGFNLSGSYHYTTLHSELPQIFANEAPEKSDSDTGAFSVGLGHRLPFNGEFSSGATRTTLDLNSTGGAYSGTLDSAYAGVVFNPLDRLSVGANTQYLDNLTGAINQAIAGAGGVVVETTPGQSSHSLDLTTFASYALPKFHITLNGSEEHRNQVFQGADLSSDLYTGTASYANQLFGGLFNATAGLVRTSINPGNDSRVGLIASANYSRDVRAWTLSVLGNYSQDQQTLLVSYITNNLGYSATVGRRFGRRNTWTNVVSGSRTGVVNQPGSNSFSQSFSSSLQTKWISATGAYSHSSGNSILTGSGLVPTPVPVTILNPTGVVLFGGNSYSFGVGSTPLHGLTLSASYSLARVNTENGVDSSNNRTSQVNARIIYLIRKIYFQAGYTKLVQGFSLTPGPAGMLSSYYAGISRWFNFF